LFVVPVAGAASAASAVGQGKMLSKYGKVK